MEEADLALGDFPNVRDYVIELLDHIEQTLPGTCTASLFPRA
jgi:hypothetical protein